jgi:hypothetical protein
VSFLVSFFLFAAVGTWLSHRIALLPSFCLSLCCVAVMIWRIAEGAA